MHRKIIVIHGPNLNMLGTRQPDQYGAVSLGHINQSLQDKGRELNFDVTVFQSNHEGEIVEKIQSAVGTFDGVIINPAAFTHTSVAIRDALLAVGIPFIEVHLSNVHAREPFRQHSYLSDCAVGVITGLGAAGYEYALDAAFRRLGQD